jgi:hypothetical protein
LQDVVVEKLALKSRAYLGYTASVIVIIANGARVVRSAFLPTLKTARLYAIWANQEYGRERTLDLVIKRGISAVTVEQLCIGERPKLRGPASLVGALLMTLYPNQQ